ncbi:MAG TPA: hypothetical protein VFW23_18085, partial [Tepidisphaeraceae bacterium]|nr:hypothetical protein [Tepidisphaeraceae bacterium]
NNVCMQMIGVDEVYRMVDDALRGKNRLKLDILPGASGARHADSSISASQAAIGQGVSVDQ